MKILCTVESTFEERSRALMQALEYADDKHLPITVFLRAKEPLLDPTISIPWENWESISPKDFVITHRDGCYKILNYFISEITIPDDRGVVEIHANFYFEIGPR